MNDAGGNLVRNEKASTRVREYAWDHRNRLTTVTDRDTAAGPATQQIGFVYDAFDRRVGKIVDVDGAGPQLATKRWTMYDGQDVYADLDAEGAVQSRYLHGQAVDMLLGRLESDAQTLTRLNAAGQTTQPVTDWRVTTWKRTRTPSAQPACGGFWSHMSPARAHR